MSSQYMQVSAERYNILSSNYKKFQDAMNEVDLDPVRVFNPLSQKQLDEIILIREVSKDLQIKKNEDVSKAAKAEEEAKKIEDAAAAENAETTVKEDA